MTIGSYNDSIVIGEMFRYLDDLREGGGVNMFGAGPYLREEFGLSRPEALEVLFAWQKTFNPNSTPEDRATKALEVTK